MPGFDFVGNTRFTRIRLYLDIDAPRLTKAIVDLFDGLTLAPPYARVESIGSKFEDTRALEIVGTNGAERYDEKQTS